MNCKFDEKILHLYVDGELSHHTQSRLKEHLEFCQHCGAVVESISVLKSELSRACAHVKAPEYLFARITADLDEVESSRIEPLNLVERFKLTFLSYAAMRNLAMGLTLALILFIVLIPGNQGISSIAGELAEEHLRGQVYAETADLQSDNAGEIILFFEEKLGLHTFIPEHLHEKYRLEGAGIVQVEGQPTAHIRYTDGANKCSMFILENPQLKPDQTRLFVAFGIQFEICHLSDLNFICWQEGGQSYILCGNCCMLDLVNMAVSSI